MEFHSNHCSFPNIKLVSTLFYYFYSSRVRQLAPSGGKKIADASGKKTFIGGLNPKTPYNFTIYPDVQGIIFKDLKLSYYFLILY